jgi:hypothetical protein
MVEQKLTTIYPCPFNGYNNIKIVKKLLERNVDYDRLRTTHDLIEYNENFELWVDRDTIVEKLLPLDNALMSGDGLIVRKK